MRYLNAFIATALLLLPGAAMAAQPQQSSEYTPPGAAQQPNQAGQPVSDEQLQQFATAMESVREVQQEYTQAIQDAGNMEDAQTLRADAQEEMRDAVEDSGLSVSEYNTISQRLQSDPNLSRRLDGVLSP